MNLFKKILIVLFLFSMSKVVFPQTPSIDIECMYGSDRAERFTVPVHWRSLISSKANAKLNYRFFIKDMNQFDPSEDYVVVKDRKGYNITYSMMCKKLWYYKK